MSNQFLKSLIRQKEVYIRIKERVVKTPLEKSINRCI